MIDVSAGESVAAGPAKELVPVLRGLCREGQPWPEEVGEVFASLQATEVHHVLRAVGLRDRIFKPKGPMPAWHKLAVDHQRDNLSWGTRAQLMHFISRLKKSVRLKLLHIYQIRCADEYYRRKAADFYSLTYLGADDGPLPGSRFVPMDKAQAVVLSLRDHRFRDGHVSGMWDLKSLRFGVERATHRVLLGGHTAKLDGRLDNRVPGAWHFNLLPHDKAFGVIVDTKQEVLIETALAMHWEIEQASLQESPSIADVPEFPRVWLGFRRNDEVDPELDAPGLRYQSWLEVATWFQARRPSRWPSLPCIGRHDGDGAANLGLLVRNPGDCWDDLVPQLGEYADDVLLAMIAKTQVEDGHGLHLLPLDFFRPGSKQKPLAKAVQVLLDFDGLMGRASDDPRSDVGCDDTQARIQVVSCPSGTRKVGMSADISYDFETVVPWQSWRFLSAWKK